MDEIPAPDIVLGFGLGLDRISNMKFSPAFAAWKTKTVLLPYSVNLLEIHLPAAALEKTSG